MGQKSFLTYHPYFSRLGHPMMALPFALDYLGWKCLSRHWADYWSDSRGRQLYLIQYMSKYFQRTIQSTSIRSVYIIFAGYIFDVSMTVDSRNSRNLTNCALAFQCRY